MKNVLLTMASVLLTSAASQAMIAPWYENIRRIDDAVEEVATKKLNYDNVDEAMITGIEVGQDGIITVGIDNTLCQVKVTAKQMKPGLVGAPSLVSTVQECGIVNAELKAVSYEKVSAKMDSAAKLAKMIQKVEITKSGKIKITSRK